MSPANEPMLYKAWLRFSLFTGECRGFVGVFNTAGPSKPPHHKLTLVSVCPLVSKKANNSLASSPPFCA